jgi:uncharacterized integral membrane protein
MSADDRTDVPPADGGDPDIPRSPEADKFTTERPALLDAAPAERTDTAGEPAGAEKLVEHHFVGTGVFWGLVVGVILAVIVIVFAAQNTQSATVNVLAWDWTAPVFVIVLLSLVIGIVLDEIVGLLFRARRRRRLSEKAELARLRGRH